MILQSVPLCKLSHAWPCSSMQPVPLVPAMQMNWDCKHASYVSRAVETVSADNIVAKSSCPVAFLYRGPSLDQDGYIQVINASCIHDRSGSGSGSSNSGSQCYIIF